ncbi:MAG: transcriptional repressor [Phycisphaeraceae bacterium]|nr:transcriptional repressor [Phycisphaeraceae bacterium]
MPKTNQVGKRNTAQRRAVLDVINQAHGPLTVGEVLDQAGKRIPNLGIATVYRTINLLLEAQQIRAVTLPDGQTRYESAELEHHHHFRCTRCNQVFDMEGCMLQMPPGTVLPGGFVVQDHELTILGTCPKCGDSRIATPRRSCSHAHAHARPRNFRPRNPRPRK